MAALALFITLAIFALALWAIFVDCRQRLANWRQRRAVQRLIDERLAVWRALPPEEQARWVHPASPRKPPGWSLSEYKARGKRKAQ